MAKIVEFKILPVRSDSQVLARVRVERNRGSWWEKVREFEVLGGGGEKRRRLLLNENERVVIEGEEVMREVWDDEQNSVKWVGGKVERAVLREDEDGI